MIYLYCALGILICLAFPYITLKNRNRNRNRMNRFPDSEDILISQCQSKNDISGTNQHSELSQTDCSSEEEARITPDTNQRWKLPRTNCSCEDKQEEWDYDEGLGCWYVSRECDRCEYYWEGPLYIHEDPGRKPGNKNK